MFLGRETDKRKTGLTEKQKPAEKQNTVDRQKMSGRQNLSDKTESRGPVSQTVIGYDLGDETSQISCWLPGNSMPETISTVMGEEQYAIPTVLCRLEDRDLWLYGKEAEKSLAAGNGIRAAHLLAGALEETVVQIGETNYDSVTLLSLFIRRSLSLLAGYTSMEKTGAFLFTLDKVDRRSVDMLLKAAVLLSIPAEKIFLQSRAESFFHYNINQPEELWKHEVLVCDFTGSCLKILSFKANHHTRPVTAFIKEEVFPQMRRENLPEEQPALTQVCQRMDRLFSAILSRVCEGRIIDTVYLIGDGFSGEWYKESLPILCRGRRVFQGNNLYSKGACYGARRRLDKETRPAYIYVGEDMLRANIGLEVLRGGEADYYPLLDAGINWYNAIHECDFLLDAESAFSLRITPLSGREVKEVIVTLDGVPLRPARTTRIHLSVSMSDGKTVHLKMEDMGFGEFFEATHKVWEEQFRLEE